MPTILYNYTLRLADESLILGHRLSEWCGHGPVLEQDIAMINIALDLIGQARNYYQYAAQIENSAPNPPNPPRTEDDIAYLRDVPHYRNALLVEQPNGNFAQTIMRQFLFDVYHYYFLESLQKSGDETLSACAHKSIKEVTYHLRWSSEWVIRLGDGTAESHHKIEEALSDLWSYSGELLSMLELDYEAVEAGFGVNLEELKVKYNEKVIAILTEATLPIPANNWMRSGGRQGKHSEHLGYILADLQFIQRAYPNSKW
jgi:ring-1,2-phenylacetyl-CoA epoxidase subunit PaaC